MDHSCDTNEITTAAGSIAHVNFNKWWVFQICHLRNKSHIHVKEEDNLPDPIESFDDLVTRYGISEQLRANITYTQPTPVQMQALPALLEKRELLALAPTGSGKTAAFVIPLLHHLEQKRQQQQLQAIILVPTRELAKQIYREVDKLCVGLEVFPHLLQSTEEVPPCVSIFTLVLQLGVVLLHLELVVSLFLKNFILLSYTKQMGDVPDLLVTTPNRLVYLLNQTPCSLNMAKVKWLVVDECDKLFEAKHENSFRSQLATIYKACCGKNIRRALFSATYMAEVETWTQQYLNSPAVFYIGQKNFAVSTVKQEVLFCGQDSGKELAMEQLIAGGYTAPILVFVNTRARAYAVYRFVRTLEPKAKCFHSHLKEHERDAIMEQFADQKIPILVTTDIFSWGMDFDISLVVNYDVPHSLRTYVNRIGRFLVLSQCSNMFTRVKKYINQAS
ncbi:DDX52 [Cordylochernes scorpioides]|uniref:ATP-dependent RNA helicase n=1 Tax=Cordylochernes scorpioides TaxID=51811 RepID=A0ABY6KTS5_9ARAC|nr:DDX52 [Cordylochernes scorpioides]